jgi:hypothetical protein
MDPQQEICVRLLAQHAYLRELIDEVRTALGPAPSAREESDRRRESVARLANALREHNRQEEMQLRGMLRDVDAWGAVRVEIMDEEHRAEHNEFSTFFQKADDPSTPGLDGVALAPALDRVLAHMDREERMFLSHTILHGDGFTGDHFGG